MLSPQITRTRFPSSGGDVCPELRTASFAHIVASGPQPAGAGGRTNGTNGTNGTTLAFAAVQHREAPW